MFAIVEFAVKQGGYLSVVNSNWLTPRKKEVFWPPYKNNQQFVKALKNSENIITETWKLYKIRKIFYETGM